MPLANLDSWEREVVRECLRAAVESPFFHDEFHTIFGLQPDDVRRVLQSWPDLDENDESVVVAINNSFNNLLGYPIEKEQEEMWPKFVSVSRTELARIFDKWKGRTPRSSYKARDYFDDLM